MRRKGLCSEDHQDNLRQLGEPPAPPGSLLSFVLWTHIVQQASLRAEVTALIGVSDVLGGRTSEEHKPVRAQYEGLSQLTQKHFN